MTPVRIQRRRVKGWKMPENTVSVCRPGPLGNPFTIAQMRECGFRGTDEALHCDCVLSFRKWVDGSSQDWMGPESDAARARLMSLLPSLRGKNLACWCPLDQPCHADVLLELANREVKP